MQLGIVTPVFTRVPGTHASWEAEAGIEEAARIAMKEPEIRIEVSIGSGPGASRALGCDLSYEYVRINGEYTT